MKNQPRKPNKQILDFDKMARHSAGSGFIREAIIETRSFVKEISRTKHTPPSATPATVTKAHLYSA